MSVPTHTRTLCIAAILASLAGASLAQVANPSLQEQNLIPIIQSLDSKDLAEREAAQALLGAQSTITLREVLGLLSEVSSLTPEQRARLVGLAREMFVDSPRAAMGVQFGGTVEKGVAIQSAVEGFDSARVIRPGDAIVEVDGEPVTQSRLRAIILSHDPGEAMDLKLLRLGENGAEEFVDARITLGSMSRLRGGGFIDAGTMVDAWRERLARAGVAEGPPGVAIETGVDRAVWLESAQMTARWVARTEHPGTARAPGAGIAGEPRSEWLDPGVDSLLLQDAESLEPRFRPDRDAVERMTMREELTELQRQLEGVRGAMRLNASALQNPEITPSQRRRLDLENQRLGVDGAAIELRMSELRGRLNRRQ